MNSITLSKLSTTAAQQQKSSTGANFPYFQKYIDYFTSPDYSDKIVQAAFAGTSVTLNGKVFDFVNHPLGARDRKCGGASSAMCLKATSFTHTVLVLSVTNLKRCSKRRLRTQLWSWQ